LVWCQLVLQSPIREGRAGMSITPEYGEEELVSGREQRIEERSAGVSSPGESAGEAEVRELAREDRELRTTDFDDNEAHAAGQVCERCGLVIAANQDARRLLDGRWVHEECPLRPAQDGRSKGTEA
jgi:hypothetical protein